MKRAAIKAALGSIDGIAAWLTQRTKQVRKEDRAVAFGLFCMGYFLYSITATFEETDER